jgi:predicted DNA-binding transcriptional regulator AlpA
MLDIGDLARTLTVSPRTVRRLDASGRLPRAVWLGGSKLWRADEVREWVAAGCPDRARWEQSQKQSGSPKSIA